MTKNHIDYLANLEQARHNRISEQQQDKQISINKQQANAATKQAKVAAKNAVTNRLQYKADKKYKDRTGKASLIQARASKSQAKSSAKQAKAAGKQAAAAVYNAKTNALNAQTNAYNAQTQRFAAQWNHAYQDAMSKVASEGNVITKDYNDKWLNQKQEELDALIAKYTSESNLNKVKSAKEATTLFTSLSHALNEWYNSFTKKGELRVKEGKLKVDKYNAMTNNILAQYKSLDYVTKSFKNLTGGVADLFGIGALTSKIGKVGGTGKAQTSKTKKK